MFSASVIAGLMSLLSVAPEAVLDVPNAGFESIGPDQTLPQGWRREIGGGANASVCVDNGAAHAGSRSLRISNASPLQAFVFAACSSEKIPVTPATTYVVRCFAKGVKVRSCFLGVSFDGGGDRRQYLAEGDFEWRALRCTFSTPDQCRAITLRFACDDVTESVWFDDIELSPAPRQLTHLTEKRYPKDFPGVFPRSKGPVAEHLAVFDCTRESGAMALLLSTLQGLVNRSAPRLYLIHRTNPPDFDNVWLQYMQEKGYTGTEERLADGAAVIERFRSELGGAIVYDTQLPGAVNAACMIAGVRNALPATAELAERLHLPVVEDLRGRFTHNVDAYRYVYDTHWKDMSHHVLSWIHPLSENPCARDYMAEFNAFCFWQSGYADNEAGADPAAEEEFIDELLSETPANIPVMGWPAHGDHKGIQEYTGVRWLSEYGKFVPGTEFCSNLSVHSAIRPPAEVFRQKHAEENAPPATGKTYLAVNILDSGDALWYWQLHQRKIWADPVRGQVPIGWCMNVTLNDTLPLVQQWYYEHATANDTFFAAISGLGYMNTQVYASRFRTEDRERIWKEYVELTDAYCGKLDIGGVALYNGSWGETTPPDSEVFRHFTRGMPHLRYILADLGRHENIQPDKACYVVDSVPVFHTLTRFQVWSSSADVLEKKREEANAWLAEEIRSHTPSGRPAFMSSMAISWYYYPAWVLDLKEKLGSEYILVGPGELAQRFRVGQGNALPRAR